MSDQEDDVYKEPFRPIVHYSQPRGWMNDPNGLVFHKGKYHLFYQHNPLDTVWGPMHWGHALSTDLIHWSNLPIALSPNELGTIFSGCALVDKENLTGLGSVDSDSGEVLLAIFTQHIESDTVPQLQRQSLAFSLDEGHSWAMYEKNPLIDNPGLKDFRDPNVFKCNGQYCLTLAAGDRVLFYKSSNLLNWDKLNEFGTGQGNHEGVWECPDLFPLICEDDGQEYWILLVSVNPGGPNSGSATQYFVGHFDGQQFVNHNEPGETLWLDHGPDSYAGITYFTESKKCRQFISWMNNWIYANEVPTCKWRGQMVFPRNLTLKSVNGRVRIASEPLECLSKLYNQSERMELPSDLWIPAGQTKDILQVHLTTLKSKAFELCLTFDLSQLSEASSLELVLVASDTEYLVIGFSNCDQRFYLNRSHSFLSGFNDVFMKTAFAPRILNQSNPIMKWRLILDQSSVELFADNGLSVLTALYYFQHPMKNIQLSHMSNGLIETNPITGFKLVNGFVQGLNSIWKNDNSNQ